MDLHTTLEFLSGITYKPGWTISVGAADNTALIVYIEFSAPNSDVGFAPDYSRVIPVTQCRTLMYAECRSEEDLIRRMFELVLEVELHEMREFFSVRGTTYWKPVHPHTAGGRAMWSEWSTEALMV